MTIGPYIILRKSDFPHIEKARKLARSMTLAEIDDILNGKAHVHGNPKRKTNQAALPIGTRPNPANPVTGGVDL